MCASKALLPLKRREGMGAFLEREGFTTGAELGVKKGWFSQQTLETWPSCKKYLLVDIWAHQDNYVESANVDDAQQQQFMEVAQQRLAPWASKTVFMRMYTTQAAAQVQDESLEYVYVDARHDYCGCLEDMVAWWPKVKPGGILAGHDYIDAAGMRAVHPLEDWALCANGTRHEGAVQGAVHDFAVQHGLTVAVAYQEAQNPFKTWMVRKPSRC